MLPGPLRHRFLNKYGGALAEPHLLIKYAVRYKGAGESVGLRAYPLAAASAAEVFEAEPVDLDEAAVSEDEPAGVRYGEVPEWLSEAGARGLERAIKERLPSKLAIKRFLDPITKTASEAGESREDLGKRIETGGGGATAERLRDQLEKKKRDLAVREQELSGRKTEKWTAVGAAILSNIGLLTGRKRSISGATTVLSKNRMENTAEARVEGLRAEISELEAKLAAVASVDPDRLEEEEVVPARTDVKVLRYDVVWIY
jgi:hypothetical protein